MMAKKFISASVNPMLIILTLVIGSVDLLGQQKVGTTSFQFLKVMPDGRATGMADAVSAHVDGSIAVFHNPAGLTSVGHYDIMVSNYAYFFGVNTSSFSGAYTFPNVGSIGLQLIYTDIGSIEVTRVDQMGFVGEVYNPGLTGEVINPNHSILGISFARALTRQFSFGITSKHVTEDLGPKATSGTLFDAGLIYDTDFRSIKTSAVIRNFGGDIQFVEGEYPAPQTLVIGVSANIIGPGSSLITTTDSNVLMFAFDLMGPRDYDQQYNLGFEWSYQEYLKLRSGYKFNYDTEGLSLGLGLHFKKFEFDYSYANYGEYLPGVHRFSLGMSIK